MIRILIPSDDPSFLTGLARAYRECGSEVVVGSQNFFLGTAAFDIVHFMWPETFCYRRAPDDKLLKKVSDRLEWWRSRSRLIISVNNFYPHGFEGNPAYKQLYRLFYSACSGIHHFSNISREMVCREWPEAAAKKNDVTLGFNYAHLVRPDADRVILRRELGLNDDEFAVLVFGALRKWNEIQLLRAAFSAVKVPGKRLIAVARFHEGGTIRTRLRRYRWELWKRRHRAIGTSEFVAEEDVYRYFESADVVVVPRIDSLSSGIPSLAMTFGKLVIGPNHGAFPEYVNGTGNILYQSGNALSLARAIEQASRVDRIEVGQRNRAVANECNWARVASCCLRLAGLEGTGDDAILSACSEEQLRPVSETGRL